MTTNEPTAPIIPTDVYAIPGKHSVIDEIHPITGLTVCYGHTAAEVKAREPLAVRMSWAEWKQAAIARQQTPISWLRTTRERYHDMLEILPPAMWTGGAFLVGEPMDHDVATGRPRFAAFWQRGSSDDFAIYLESSRPITFAELRAELSGVGISK